MNASVGSMLLSRFDLVGWGLVAQFHDRNAPASGIEDPAATRRKRAHRGEFDRRPLPHAGKLLPLEIDDSIHSADNLDVVDAIHVHICNRGKLDQWRAIDGHHHSLPAGFSIFALVGGVQSPNLSPRPETGLHTYDKNVSIETFLNTSYARVPMRRGAA